MDRRRYLGTLALGVGTIGLTGCTGNGDGTTTEDPTTTVDGTAASPTETSTDKGTETQTATPEPPADPDQRVAVDDGLSFDLEEFEIAVSYTVLWERVGGGHNVKYDDGAVPEGTDWEGTEGSRTTTYGEGHVHWHTFETPGEYAYYCVPH